MVGERSTCSEARSRGLVERVRSENAGMSNEKRVRISFTESLRFPEEGSSAQGKSGPKLRPKGVGNGQQVEIPVPPHDRLNDGATQEDRKCARLEACVQAVRKLDRKIRPTISSCDGEGNMSTEVSDFTLPRKSSSNGLWCPYPKPTQVGTESIRR